MCVCVCLCVCVSMHLYVCMDDVKYIHTFTGTYSDTPVCGVCVRVRSVRGVCVCVCGLSLSLWCVSLSVVTVRYKKS